MPYDLPAATADSLVGMLTSYVLNRPELKGIRDRIQTVLSKRAFRVLSVQAFETFAENLTADEKLADYFDSGMIEMPAVQEHLTAYIVNNTPIDVTELARLHAKRHLKPVEAADIQPLLNDYLKQLRETFYNDPTYGEILHRQDTLTILAVVERIEAKLDADIRDLRRPAPGAKPRVFISYSRKDGEDFAANLREQLLDESISLWQDRAKMEGGKNWWNQITDALETCHVHGVDRHTRSDELAHCAQRMALRTATGRVRLPGTGARITDRL